uniref:Retrotransposon protein, putative, Ty1-copia subclass n=1 Tax=Oryza sativa subsp. japonica TaxID=39947 RepID=Q2QSF5_ORYSJ|nr:retrotransposon protein, putative, Ty1-copia subclass [Oryza sativa Japonica Group]
MSSDGVYTPAPIRHGSGCGGSGDLGGHERVVQQVKEAGVSLRYPMLEGQQQLLAACVEPRLTRAELEAKAQGLWSAVEPGDNDRVDRQALAAILRAVPPEMLSTLAIKETVQEAWQAIKIRRIGVRRVREANEQQLRREFADMCFKDGESVDDFSLRLCGPANNLHTLGDEITEAEVVKKLLHVVPENLQQIAISIETLLELTRCPLKSASCGRATATTSMPTAGYSTRRKNGWLSSRELLLWRQWRPPGLRTWEEENNGASKETQPKSNDAGRNPGNCTYCGKRGHWAKDCRSKPKPQQAHVAQEDDEGPTLLLARAELDSVPTLPLPVPPLPRATPATPPQSKPLEVVQAKVFASLDDAAERSQRRWILDTGATNHMTGSRSLFAELDTAITGTVKFGDGLVVSIEGRDTILFACKTGEHRALTGVYFIPRLTANIVSLRQIDEAGSKVLIYHEVLRIWDPQGRLLVRVDRSRSRLVTPRNLALNFRTILCIKSLSRTSQDTQNDK